MTAPASTAAISGYLRTIIEVNVAHIEQLTYSEFIHSLPNPTCFNLLKSEQLDGQICLELSPLIVYPIIDRPDWDFRTFAIAADFRILQISKLWKEKFSMKAFWQYYHFLISNFKRGNPSNHYLSISGFKRSFISLISQLLNFTDRL